MAIIQHRWRLKVGEADFVEVHPRGWGEAVLKTESPKDEMYFRTALENVTLIFQREDYELIQAADYQTEFTVELQEHDGTDWVTIDTSTFWYTDIKLFDVDNSTIQVVSKTTDDYEAILEGMEKEFDLIALEPPTVSVDYLKQAIIQVYFPGADFIANFTDGVWYELQCTPFATTPDPGDVGTDTNHLAMLNDYGFGIGRGYATPGDGLPNYARVVIPGDGLSPDVSGVYYAQSYSASEQPQMTINKATSYIREDGVYAIVNDGSPPPGQIKFFIRRVSDDVDVFESDYFVTPWSPFGQPPHSSPNAVFTNITDPTQTCEAYEFLPYVRLLTNLEEINGDATTLIPDDDPFPHGSYTHCFPVETLTFEYAFEASATPTRWGKVSDDAIHFAGDYFVKPTMTETLMPVLRTTWTAASAWFYLNDELRELQQDGSEPITLKHCYKLSDVIAKLLEAVQSDVTHEDSEDYSEFLYAASNAIRGSRKVPVITPKSNVLIGEYDQPATKGLIRFSEVRDLLRYFHRVYWHVEDSKFRLEHLYYYHFGATYGGANVGTDLTELLEPRTGKPWATSTNRYRYEKQDLAERIETQWMDSVSKPFEGYPIQVNSRYVNRGNVEQRRFAKFTSDIDFFNVAANDISKDGFVFFECLEQEVGNLYVPFVELAISADEVYNVQNGYASLIYAHANYHTHGLPAVDVNLNDADIVADSTKRSKIQEFTLSLQDEINPYELIETQIGQGRARSIERSINSNQHKLTIEHDTE